MGILSLLLWTPAIGVLLLAVTPGSHAFLIRLIANLCAALALLLSCWLLSQFQQDAADLQFSEYFPINPNLGSAYALGVDGLSLPMLLLTSLLFAVSILVSTTITSKIKGYHIAILLLEFGLLGVFSAQDWALFYVFWEITLISLFFLIDRWGGKRRHAASLNFVLYTLAGSLCMLISLLAISQHGLEHSGSLMASMNQAAKDMPLPQQILVLLGFIIGFGVKMPIFPLHGWLPLALVEAPMPVTILLAGILLKMGAYALLRVVVMLPEATHALQPLLIFLALFGMIYGGLLAWRQTDLKAMIAYSCISQMAIILGGIASLNSTAIYGAVLQMTAHGLIAASLFLLLGLVYQRSQTWNIQNYRSLLAVMPRFALLMTLSLLALMGMPGTIGFIAEIHAFIGGLQQWQGLMVFFVLGSLITAAYSLRTLSLLFTGAEQPANHPYQDLQTRELFAAGVLAIGITALGIMPAAWLKFANASVKQISHAIGQTAL